MYFAGKLVYLIVRASNQLAVKTWQFGFHITLHIHYTSEKSAAPKLQFSE